MSDRGRVVGAVVAGAAGAGLLVLGRAPWPVALLGGTAAAVFALWRTVRGAWTAFGVLLLAALAGWALGSSASYHMPRALPLWSGVLEVCGWGTIAAVRAARQPVQVSRRLLGAWLASSGAIVLGLALSPDPRAATVASGLVTFGILHKLGVVPAYAWAPMLIRHPSPRILAAGVAGFALAGAVLWQVVPLLPDRASAGWAAVLLSAVTLPWAVWQASRQWRGDRRCARTYAVVALVAAVLMWHFTGVVGARDTAPPPDREVVTPGGQPSGFPERSSRCC